MRERFHSDDVRAPKVMSDPSKFSTADDEYTPEQRKVIDARITEARKGPYHGPFGTADEAIGFLNKEIKVQAGKRKRPTSKR